MIAEEPGFDRCREAESAARGRPHASAGHLAVVVADIYQKGLAVPNASMDNTS